MNVRIRAVSRHGYITVPMITFITSLVLGIVVGILVGIWTATPWIGIVAGVGTMLVVWIIGGGIYYHSDFTRYMNIRRM